MNHSAVIHGSDFILTAVNDLNKNYSGIPLILGEVGNSLGSGKALSSSFGSALWQADFYLYCMSIGVAGINYQSGRLGFTLWSSGRDDTVKAVLPPFYGHIFAADFIGSSGQDVHVANIGLETPYLSAYGAYEGGQLKRIALIDLHVWSKSDGKRPSQNLTLAINATKATIEYMTSPFGVSARNATDITWAGMQWTAGSDGMGVVVKNDTSTINVDGTLTFEMEQSSAVIITLE